MKLLELANGEILTVKDFKEYMAKIANSNGFDAQSKAIADMLVQSYKELLRQANNQYQSISDMKFDMDCYIKENKDLKNKLTFFEKQVQRLQKDHCECTITTTT